MTRIYQSYRIICLAAGLTAFLLSGFSQIASANHKSTGTVIGVAKKGNSGRHIDKERSRDRRYNHRDNTRRNNVAKKGNLGRQFDKKQSRDRRYNHRNDTRRNSVAKKGNSIRHIDKVRSRDRRNNNRDDYRRNNRNSRHYNPTYYRKGVNYSAYNHRYDYRRNYRSSRHSYPTYYRKGYFRRDYNYPTYYKRNYYRRGNDTAQLIATATGVFFGALIVSELIHYMNDVDRMQINQANVTAQSAPIGTQITWNNPQSSNAGSIIATRDGYSESGKYCREFYQTVNIGGKTENAYGVACRQADGSWQIVP